MDVEALLASANAALAQAKLKTPPYVHSTHTNPKPTPPPPTPPKPTTPEPTPPTTTPPAAQTTNTTPSFLIMYGTQTGNSRGVAQQLAEISKTRGVDASVVGMDKFKDIEFAEKPLVLITSSTGNGDAPDNAERFLRYVKRKTTPQVFAGARFAVCAMGDSNYEQFCQTGKEFDQHVERLGGERFLKRCDVDEVDGIETYVLPWFERLFGALASLPPALGGPPAAAAAAATAIAKPPGAETSVPAGVEPDDDDLDLPGTSPSLPLLAPIVEARWLTRTTSEVSGGPDKIAAARRVLHLELDVSGLPRQLCGQPTLQPGDALAILPRHPDAEVDAILEQLQLAAGVADGPLAGHLSGGEVPAHLARASSVRDALQSCLDIGSTSTWPPLPLLKLLQRHASKDAEPRRAAQLERALAKPAPGRPAAAAANTNARVALDAIAREKPSLLELLEQLKAAPPLGALLDSLPPLAPRWYSLASSTLAVPGRATLCVSMAAYLTRGADPEDPPSLRRGVASHFLARAAAPLLEGATVAAAGALPTVPVYVRAPSGNELRLPPTPSTPIILIGPGTGLAPFRAFLQQRKVAHARSKLGSCRVYFGCRGRDDDYLYGDELQTSADAGAIELRVAFSREGNAVEAGYWRGIRLGIDYVQDLIREDAAAVADVLLKQRGHVYVCGDGQGMAGDVHTALQAAIARGASISEDKAGKTLRELSAAGRYCREIWN